MDPAIDRPAKDLFDAMPAVGNDILARPTDQSSLQFLGILARSPTPEEAISFAAYLLPKRKAVWWGHECVRSLIHLLTDQDLRMLSLAEAWVRDPDEPQRVAVMVEAMAARQKSPGVMIALAAAWSGGSIADASLPTIPPAPHLTPRAVSGGVLKVLARVDNTYRATTLSHFVDMSVYLAAR